MLFEFAEYRTLQANNNLNSCVQKLHLSDWFMASIYNQPITTNLTVAAAIAHLFIVLARINYLNLGEVQ